MNRAVLLCLPVALAAACAQPADEGGAPAAVVSLREVDRAAYDALLAERRGQVVLVDFWATWCAPCLKQLPHTVELAERHKDAGLAVLTVSMDEASARAQAEKAIADRDPRGAGVHLVSKLGGGSAAMEAFDIGSGALPHYKLYDRAGELRRTFELDPLAAEQFTVDDIDAAVAELLAEPAEGADAAQP